MGLRGHGGIIKHVEINDLALLLTDICKTVEIVFFLQ